MKYIIFINSLYVKRFSIDSYDGTTRCEFSSHIGDAMEFSENELNIIVPLIDTLLSIEVNVKLVKDGDQDVK